MFRDIHVNTNKTKTVTGKYLPDMHFTYGRANRPATPVGGIIRNEFAEAATFEMTQKYTHLKELRTQHRGSVGIRMTNAQLAADNAIKQKITPCELKPEFKLKRF
jgi:hypothetical protein